MPALQGVGVLVTRPEHQAEPLCGLLESAGARVVRLPAIEIKPAGNLGELLRRLGREAFDLILFTSANAVRFGSPLLDRNPGAKLAAIGPATARALAQAGYSVAAPPGGGFDSESLLKHPALAHPAGQRILLIKGMHGRELLQQQLTERGAVVVVAEVYLREPARHEPREVAALVAKLAAGEIQVITATSVEIAAALLDAATPALRRGFDHVHWVVPGARVAAALRERGLKAPMLQAATAADQDLVAAIKRWRARVSGA